MLIRWVRCSCCNGVARFATCMLFLIALGALVAGSIISYIDRALKDHLISLALARAQSWVYWFGSRYAPVCRARGPVGAHGRLRGAQRPHILVLLEEGPANGGGSTAHRGNRSRWWACVRRTETHSLCTLP